MSIGVVLRRSRATAVLGRATGVLAIMIACSALIGTPSSAADPYPPTPPCSLAWSATTTSDNSVLIGSGLGDSQSVSVVLEPQATVLGTYVTDETGAFQASVSIPSATSTDATQWLRAESVKASCGTHAPPRGGPSTPPPTSPAPSTTSPSEQPPGSSGVPGTSPAPSTGTTGLGGGVVTSGSAPADRPGGSGNNGYPVTPGSSSRGSGSGGSGGSGGSSGSAAPSSSTSAPGSTAPTSPEPTRSSPSTTVDASNPTLSNGLPASVVLTIAMLLLLGGGLAVVFLTRRAG